VLPDHARSFYVIDSLYDSLSGQSETRQDALWHERVRPPKYVSQPWHVLTRPVKDGQSPLIPSSGFDSLREHQPVVPSVSGRASGVPDVSLAAEELAVNPPLTAYLTAYGLRTSSRTAVDKGPL